MSNQPIPPSEPEETSKNALRRIFDIACSVSPSEVSGEELEALDKIAVIAAAFFPEP